MSYKVEMIDEYSFGRWFSDRVRFATAEEAEESSQHVSNVGWLGILDIRVVQSDDPVNARWTDKGILNLDGQLFYPPPPPPTKEEILADANRLRARRDALLASIERERKRHA